MNREQDNQNEQECTLDEAVSYTHLRYTHYSSRETGGCADRCS